MEKLLQAGRWNYALGLGGMALQHFFYPGFRPVFVPEWPVSLPEPNLLIFTFSIALFAVSDSIIFDFRARNVSMLCGAVLLADFLFIHFPIHIKDSLTNLVGWTNAFKVLGLSGGAFVVADSFSRGRWDKPSRAVRVLGGLIPFGKIFFAIMLVVFGIDHFLYAGHVATLVPAWIPGSLFWTYFAAVALIGSGVSIIFNVKVRFVATLTGIMIFTWLLILHIPRAVAMPDLQNGNELTSVFQALAFSGIAFVLAAGDSHAKNKAI